MSTSIANATRFGSAGFSMPWMESAEIALSGPVLNFVAERRIFAEGDEARSYYKVVSGVVRTCQFLSDGRRQIDAFYLPGDVFGFEPRPTHRLSAEAVSNCTVIAYRRRGPDTGGIADDRMVRHFFCYAMTCLEQSRLHCLLLGRGSAAQKIAAFLLEMADRGDAPAIVDLPMSRQDVADYLGLTIETVSRTLSQMERDGTIALPTTRKVVLRKRQVLEDLNA
ncbi:MAG TPA: helix-turn-helix domain-containing protein [Rhodopila sp.]|jgi:CRP/FNR family nitrogen fixation transcriptional regulator|nr:helix-turn-helix domain-containing protein [Rhodopila sp.]